MSAREKLKDYLNKNSWQFYDRRILMAPRRKLAKEFGCCPSVVYYLLKSLQRKKQIKTAYYANGKPSIYEI